MLRNIPPELQQLAQWVVATGAPLPDGKRDKVPLNPRTGIRADVTDRNTWGTFEEALQSGYPLKGFVLSADDPYCIIDLDNPIDGDFPELSKHRVEGHEKIAQAFQTYAEFSQSGQGLHIICKASVPHGVKRDKVEIYSQERYMICTGDAYRPFPIVDCQALVTSLFEEMNAHQPKADLVQVDGLLGDEEIYNMACNAANSAKFRQLWQGEWQTGEWPSQSEADFALMSMFAFYSKDNAQCIRLFKMSGLGQRSKAHRAEYYTGRYGMLNKIRAKDAPRIDFSKLNISTHANKQQPISNDTFGSASEERPTDHSTIATEEPSPVGAGEGTANDAASSFAFPPGFIGELADYIFTSSIRPVKEIALVAAIALTAGVAGRAYNISGSGLNQYLILLARTGRGKEGAATGIDMMVQAVRSQVPSVDQFIGPGAFSSGQALVRVLDKQECFVSVLGEFGLTLQGLCDPKANNAVIMLKKVLLDVYQKSGQNKTLKPSVYSEAEKNTRMVQAPNITILGESTPESFYDGLDATAIAQGLIPRFSIFEYDGPRPPRNDNAFHPPPRELVDSFSRLLIVAVTSQTNRAFCPVQIEPDALRLLNAFDEKATSHINKGTHSMIAELWNRAHLKTLKLAALVAVGVNVSAPVVTCEFAQWAIALTERDINRLTQHFLAGEIGQGDSRLESDVRRAVDHYLRSNQKQRREYQVSEKIIEKPIVPLVYLKRRLRQLVSFTNDRRGANAALGATLKAMCESGELQAMNPTQATMEFSINTPLYVIGPNW